MPLKRHRDSFQWFVMYFLLDTKIFALTCAVLWSGSRTVWLVVQIRRFSGWRDKEHKREGNNTFDTLGNNTSSYFNFTFKAHIFFIDNRRKRCLQQTGRALRIVWHTLKNIWPKNMTKLRWALVIFFLLVSRLSLFVKLRNLHHLCNLLLRTFMYHFSVLRLSLIHCGMYAHVTCRFKMAKYWWCLALDDLPLSLGIS